MAQVVGGSMYDFEWDRKHDAALLVLSREADQCVGAGLDAHRSDRAVAATLRIFGDRFLNRNYSRSPEEWCRVVEDVPAELLRLKPQLDLGEITEITQQLRSETAVAADKWALGDPENPPTADVLNVLEHVLFRHRVIKNPPKYRTPTSLHT